MPGKPEEGGQRTEKRGPSGHKGTNCFIAVQTSWERISIPFTQENDITKSFHTSLWASHFSQLKSCVQKLLVQTTHREPGTAFLGRASSELLRTKQRQVAMCQIPSLSSSHVLFAWVWHSMNTQAEQERNEDHLGHLPLLQYPTPAA